MARSPVIEPVPVTQPADGDPNDPGATATPTFRRLLADRGALVSFIVLAALLLGSILASWLIPDSATRTSGTLQSGPGARHLLGTDELGRDMGARLLIGAQASVVVAVASAFLAMASGVAVGLVSGYFGGWVDAVAMRVMDLLLALPMLLVALVVVVIVGPSSVNVILAIAVAGLPTFARLARASVLEIRDRQFVVAARAMGAHAGDILVRTVLPNIMGPIVVQFVVTAASAVVVAASLSFLGLGVPPPAPSWGAMLQESQSYLFDNPWYGLFPGLALTVTVLCLDRIGRSVQRALHTGRTMELAAVAR